MCIKDHLWIYICLLCLWFKSKVCLRCGQRCLWRRPKVCLRCSTHSALEQLTWTSHFSVLLLASQPFIVFHTIHISLVFSTFKFYLSFVALYTKDAIISMLLIVVIIDYKGKWDGEIHSLYIVNGVIFAPCNYLFFVHQSFLPSFRRTFNFSFPGLLQPDGAGPEPVNLEDDQDFEEYKTFENDDQPKEEEERMSNDI